MAANEFEAVITQDWAALSISFTMPPLCARRMHGMPGTVTRESAARLLTTAVAWQPAPVRERLCPSDSRPALPGWQPDVLDRIGHAMPRWELTGRLLGWNGSCRTLCHDDIDLSLDQLSCGLTEPIRFDSPKRRSKTMFVPPYSLAPAAFDYCVESARRRRALLRGPAPEFLSVESWFLVRKRTERPSDRRAATSRKISAASCLPQD